MRRVLVLQHVPYEGHGYLADYMQEHDIGFDVVRLWKPYALPDVSRYSALIIMGGPMGAYEEFPSRNIVSSQDSLRMCASWNGMVMRSICQAAHHSWPRPQCVEIKPLPTTMPTGFSSI
jgi:GMP synthase-like glutamine amidotransferase